MTVQTVMVSILYTILTFFLKNRENAIRNEGEKISKENIKKLEEQSELLSIKNKFIATVTHEIRNIATKYMFNNYIVL